jgi:hypothetical protein
MSLERGLWGSLVMCQIVGGMTQTYDEYKKIKLMMNG